MPASFGKNRQAATFICKILCGVRGLERPIKTGHSPQHATYFNWPHNQYGFKLTWAAAGGKTHIVDETITELEQKLDPARFFRIHRSTLVNLSYVQELHPWLGGGVLLRLKDQNRTELQVARERATAMKDKLGLT